MSATVTEVLRRQQTSDPRLAAIPTVVISANAQLRETAARLGATGYVRKPADLEMLLDTVAAHTTPRVSCAARNDRTSGYAPTAMVSLAV